MNFEEFKKQVLDDVLHHFDAVTVDIREVPKLQGQSYTGLTIRPADQEIGATMNLDAGFDQYRKTGDYRGTFESLESTIKTALQNLPEVGIDSLRNYEYLKEMLTVQLIPTEPNREILETIPHKEMEDMSIVYRVQVDSNERGNATILMTNAMLNTFGITAEAEEAMKEGKTLDVPKREEVTIKFGKGLVDHFTSKTGKELAAVRIPNPDPADRRPWESFVVPANFVHENKFGKGVWMKLPADGTTELERPVKVADLPDGKQKWKSEFRTVTNTELKALVESYKNKDRGSVLDALAGKKQEAKTAVPPKKEARKKTEPAL